MFDAARLCHVTFRGPYTNNFPKQKTCTKFLFAIFGASNNNKRNAMNLTITKDKVVEAASKCSTANQVLRVMFPEAFEPEKPKPFKFGLHHIIPDGHHGPLVVMHSGRYCPPELGGKCLMVGEDYRMETQEYEGQTLLTFYKK
jgi:hypothetical protein